MTKRVVNYNRAEKVVMVIRAFSALGPNQKIGKVRRYLDNHEAFSASKGSKGSGSLYAVLDVMEKAGLVERELRAVPITNPSRQKHPTVYFYNLTARGHKASFMDEDQVRQLIYRAGIRAEGPYKKDRRALVTTEERVSAVKTSGPLAFIMLMANENPQPIEQRFNGHHYYDPHKQRYID